MNILIPKYLTFGADIKSIEFKNNFVIKHFKNFTSYDKTKKFYNYVDYEYKTLFPKLISSNYTDLSIVTDYCGDLLNLNNLPNDWELQFNNLRNFFLNKKILILDIRFMPHTPYVINNICTLNNKIYLVDLALYSEKNDDYINKYFDHLIYQIKIHLKYKNTLLLFIIHIYFELKRLLNDLIEKIYNYYSNALDRKYK